MKRLILFLLILIISFPLVSAFSFSEFFSDFFTFTGMSVLEIGEEKIDNLEKFEKISVPKLKKVGAKEETLQEAIERDVLSESVKVGTNEQLSTGEKRSKKKFIPECSDYLDNNVNYLKKGTCKDNTRKLLSKDYSEDYCSKDGITLMEYFCSPDNFCGGSWYVCPNGCLDGACLTEKKEDLKPDLKVLSVSNGINKGIVSVKNKGSKGTYFKTKIFSENDEEISNINYYLEPDETINVELNKKIVGDYSVELLVDEDLNYEDNVFNGSVKEEVKKDEQKVTGKVTYSQDIKKESMIIKFFKFLRNFF